MHFHAIFKSLKPCRLILSFFFCQFQEVAGSKTAGATFFCGVILSLSLIQEGQLSVSGESMCTVLVMYKSVQEVRLCKLTDSKIT